MMSSEQFEKRDFLMDKDAVEWRIRSRGLGWHATRILLKGENLNQKQKMDKLGDVMSKAMLFKLITDKGLGSKPPAVGRFL